MFWDMYIVLENVTKYFQYFKIMYNITFKFGSIIFVLPPSWSFDESLICAYQNSTRRNSTAVNRIDLSRWANPKVVRASNTYYLGKLLIPVPLEELRNSMKLVLSGIQSTVCLKFLEN